RRRRALAAGTGPSPGLPSPRHRPAAPRCHAQSGTARLGAARAASALFCEQLLGGIQLQGALRQEALEPAVLPFPFTQSGRLRDRHVAVFLAPAREGCLGDTVRSADGCDGLLTPLRLLQDPDDLFLADLPLLHAVPPDACPLGRTLTYPLA